MQKVNVYVHIWNELRSNDRFGLKGSLVDSLCFLRYYPHYYFVTILYFPRRVQGVFYSAQWRRLPRNVVAVRRQFVPHRSLDLASIASRSIHSPRLLTQIRLGFNLNPKLSTEKFARLQIFHYLCTRFLRWREYVPRKAFRKGSFWVG